MLFILVNLVSAGAFKHHKKVNKLLVARPKLGQKYRKLRLDRNYWTAWYFPGGWWMG